MASWLAERCRELGCQPPAYLSTLSASPREWELLLGAFVNGESYFLRDPGQMAVLRDRVLPALAALRGGAPVRVWSAGCSNGEEPYSLAILAAELRAAGTPIELQVFATDINPAALAAGARAVYNDWALRVLSEEQRSRWFIRRDKLTWVLQPELRSCVSFHRHNLGSDDLLPAGLHTAELVLCRNVFIYFHRDAVDSALRRFQQVLSPGGYLLAGHTELHGQNLGALRPVSLPGSVVYQRGDAVGAAPAPPVPLTRPAVPVTAASRPTPVAAAETVRRGGGSDATLFAQAAWLAAERGESEAARQWCQRALAADVLQPLAYYVLAQLAEDEGEPALALELLQRVSFLDPNLHAAQLDLATAYERNGEARRARQTRQAVLAGLTALPPATIIDPPGELTAGELRAIVARQLDSGGEA